MNLKFLGCTTPEQDNKLLRSIEALNMDGPLPQGLNEAWTEFLSQPRTLDDLFAHPLLFPLQRRAEVVKMLSAAEEVNPATLLDIGTDKGGSLWMWLNALPTLQRVIACEIRGLPYAAAFEQAFPQIDFLWLPASSYAEATLRTIESWSMLNAEQIGNRGSAAVMKRVAIDVAFLDGDKAWFHRDFELYQPLLSATAVAFMHDIQDQSPREAFELCRKSCSSSQEIIDVSDWEMLRHRLTSGRQTRTEHEAWLKTWQGRSCGVGVLRP